MDFSPSTAHRMPNATSAKMRIAASSAAGVGVGTSRMQAWREGIAKAQERIQALKEVLGSVSSLEGLHESERPAKGLLEDEHVTHAILVHLTSPSSGNGQDALCQWLYDTFQTGEPDLQAVVLRYIPALCGLYLPRITSHTDESLAGFEAVLLALYAAETKARNGCSVVVNIPDLSQPSLYHAPRIPSSTSLEPRLGLLSAPLEPQDAVKATKRACIVGIALDLFCRRISVMPHKAKIEACQCASRLAMLSCTGNELLVDADDEDVDLSTLSGHGNGASDSVIPLSSMQMPEIEIVGPGELFLGNKSPAQSMVSEVIFSPKCLSSMKYATSESPLAGKHNQTVPPQSVDTSVDFATSLLQAGNGARIPLSWELIQPLIRILGHCLLAPMKNSKEVKAAASAAVKALYCRAFHDLTPEAMLATRSLMRLEMSSKVINKTHSASGNSSSSSSKPRKPEILLVSK